MKSNKKIVGIVILIFIVVVLVLAVYRNNKTEADPTGNKSVDSATHTTRETIPAVTSAKPEINPKDGSVKIVEEYIKLNAKNPATFQFLEWSEVSTEDGYWKVRCKYRGVSSFNAEVTTNAWFYIKNNKVVYTKILSKI